MTSLRRARLSLGALLVMAVAAWCAANGRTILFEDAAGNTGLRFQHFIGATGSYFVPEIFGSGVALLDYDGDGDLDVYILQGTVLDKAKSLKDAIFPPPKDHFPGNRLFRNELIPTGKLSFTDVTEQAGVAGNGGYGMGVAVGDYDNDGHPDLFVTNYGRDILYHNNGDGTFTDVTKDAIPGEEESFGSSAAFVDYDQDGFLDLFVVRYNSFTVQASKKCSGYAGGREYCGPGDYRPIPSKLYHNDGHGHFVDVTQKAGISAAFGNGLGVVCADFDGDGRIDIFVANDKTPNQLWINKGNGTFEDKALMSGVAYDDEGKAHAGMGVTAGDFDGDGDEDIFIANIMGETHMLYRNQGKGMFQDVTKLYGLGHTTVPYTGFGTIFSSITRGKALAALAVILCLPPAAQPTDGHSAFPYRFLLVISDQWKDPASYLIDGGGQLQVIVSLLKTWGLPFDILRLDQERLDRYRLLDREGLPRYGTIIWDADPAGAQGKDLSLLPSLVKDLGVNLVFLGDSIAPPEVSALAGLNYVSEYRLGDGLTFAGDHFITRGLAGREQEFLTGTGLEISGSKVSINEAAVLAKRSHLPFLTVREFPGAGRVVWLGAHRSSVQIARQIVRDLLKRSLVWANGYALYAEYSKSMILFMDDFGTSDRTYLPYWHYRTLNEEDIRKGLIEPLKRRHAVLNQDVLTGYVDRKGRRVANPWTQQVIDEIDGKTLHDYVSAKRGLDAGLREGVFEIQCHGYTHMLPDLESPPGPFWTAPMDGAGTLGFDVEFGDDLRKQEVPAITQKFLLARGIEYIRKDFGVTPLFVINGGGAWSRSYPNNSPRIAAEMGFGLSDFGSPGYLGRDLVIPDMGPVVPHGSWAHDRKLTAADIPWTIDGPYWLIFHDRDVSVDISSAERLLTSLGDGVRYLSANEYCGYLHARIERNGEAELPVSLAVHYDDHYCRYFASHESTWILHVSDQMRRELKNAVPEKRTVTIPKGLGRHVVRVGPAAQ